MVRSPTRDVQFLVSNALHGSTTEERLTKLKSGMVSRYLYDAPLIDYLAEEEQPHFILAARQKVPKFSGSNPPTGLENNGTGMTMHMITDYRWLVVAANSNGDQTFEIPLDEIMDVGYDTGSMGHSVKLVTENSYINIPISNSYDSGDIGAVVGYLTNTTSARDASSELVDGPNNRTDVSEEAKESVLSAHLDADPQGEWVTADRISKMGNLLESDEAVHYMWRGGTVDVEGAGSGNSIFGNNRSRKASFKQSFTAATNKRVVINIRQFLGDDERHIPYRSIIGVDLDTGLVARRVSLQTSGPTYHIQAQGPSKSELRDAVRFIRRKIEEPHQIQQSSGSASPDPVEQLKSIKELHEQGVLTAEEFQEKKQSLLDQI